MRLVFVGAGRVATRMALAAAGAGHSVVAVYSRTIGAARALADGVGAVATDSIDDLPTTADAFVVAVKDDAMAQVLGRLLHGREGRLVVHTSGSVDMAVFGSHRPCGVVYPLQTLSKERAVDMSAVPMLIEADSPSTLGVVRTLASTLGGRVVEMDSDRRRHVHLAAVFANNFANHCYDLASRLMAGQGLDFDLLQPLIDETAAKVRQLTPRQAQTGPAVRYDTKVMRRHLDMLGTQGHMGDIYALMSKSIHELNGYDKL